MVYGIIPTSIKLEPSLKERVKQLSYFKQRTPHAILKEAIYMYLAHEEKTIFHALELTKRWNIHKNNKSIEHSRLSEWLLSWGTVHEQEPPACIK